MASAEAAALAAEVKIRIDNDKLVRLTNDETTPDAIIINETKLLAACDDAIGKFEIESGHEYNGSERNHVAICVSGVVMKLEDYKGKSTNLISKHQQSFFAATASLRNKTPFLALTDSQWEPSTKEGLPDMDSTQTAFRRFRRKR